MARVTIRTDRGETYSGELVEPYVGDASGDLASRLTAQVKAEDTATVLAALQDQPGAGAPVSVWEGAEFAIKPTDVHLHFNAGEFVRITRVKVVVTRYRHDDEEDDGQGYIRVEGYGRALTTKGEEDRRKERYWRALPDDLAPHLLLRAHTHTR